MKKMPLVNYDPVIHYIDCSGYIPIVGQAAWR